MKKVLPFFVSCILLISSCSIGPKLPSEPKAVGDIVFSDGSAISYSENLTLTKKQKNSAVAVIYYVGGPEDPLGERTLGVGLHHTPTCIKWCSEDASALNKKITAIISQPHGLAGKLTFNEDTDGSANMQHMAEFLGPDDDTGAPERYPAFYFARNYGFQKENHAKGKLREGWYLPALPEMFYIWKSKEIVNKASALVDGDIFTTNSFWTSSQYPIKNNCAFILYLTDGDWGDHGGTKSLPNYRACAIRNFSVPSQR